jgi:hypothetical protein
MRKRVLISLAFLVAALFLWGCQDDDTPLQLPTIIVTQTQTVQAPPGSTIAPGTSPTPTAGRIASVRVGIFAQTCFQGGSVPPNGSNTIRVGCIAMFTATPKDNNGRDLELPDEVWEKMNVVWAISGAACLDLDAPNGENRANKFNREVRGEREGTCSVCAAVEGIGGCALQPTGDRLVRVVP